MKSPRGRDAEASRHLGMNALLDYLEGRGGERLRARVENHLAGSCTACRDELAQVGHLLDVAAEASRLEEPSPALVARARMLFSQIDRRSLGDRVRAVMAELLFDSARDPVPAAVRRVAPGVRRLRYQLGQGWLELEIERQGAGQLLLRGALQCPEPESAEIRIQAGRERIRAIPESSGHFVVEGVPDETLKLEVLWSGRLFRIPALTP